MQQFLLIVHILVAIGVIALVLLQHGRGADAGAAFGSGGAGSVFGARGPTTFLTRLTTILVAVFFLTSLSLAWLSTQNADRRSVVERVQPLNPAESGAGEEQATEEGSGEILVPPAAPESGTQSSQSQ